MSRAAAVLAEQFYAPIAKIMGRSAVGILGSAQCKGGAHMEAALAAMKVHAEEVGGAVVAGLASQASIELRSAIIKTEAQKIMDAIMESARARLYAAVTEGP